MKKILTLIISLACALPAFASAASFIIVPPTGSYVVGDTVTLKFSVDPAGSTVYAAMLDARFSSDTFEVASFSLNDNMIALKQVGYDALDNATGVIIKTGGYPSGTNDVAPFGTLVLRAKGSGVGTFTIGDNSKLLDANNGDQQSGTQTVSFTITPARVSPKVPAVVPVSAPVNTVTTPEVVPAEPQTENNEVAIAVSPATSAQSTQLANVAGFVATNGVTFSILGLLALALGYRYVVSRRALAVASQTTTPPTQKGK